MHIQTKSLDIPGALIKSLQAGLLASWVYDTTGNSSLPGTPPPLSEPLIGLAPIQDKETDTEGLAVATEKTLYIVIRGTESFSEGGLKDWRNNLKAHESKLSSTIKAFGRGNTKAEKLGNALQQLRRHTSKAEFFGIQAHPGFTRSARSVLQQVLDIWNLYKQGREIVFIGHSLGGAVAVLLAVAISNFQRAEAGGRPLSLYTFGQPRVSRRRQLNLSLSNVQYIRLQNGADIVSRIPMLGYSHAGENIYLRRKAAKGSSMLDRYIAINPNSLVKLLDRSTAGKGRITQHKMTEYIKQLKRAAK